MNIIINRLKFLFLLKKLNGIICKSKNDVLFSDILIKIVDNKIFCIITNDSNEIIVYENLESKFLKSQFIIKYSLLYNVLKKVKSENININNDGKYIEIMSNDSIFRFNNKIIVFPFLDYTDKFIFKVRFDTKVILNAFKNININIFEKKIQTFSNEIFFEVINNSFNFLSSDKFRVSFCNINYLGNSFAFKSMISKKVLLEIIKLFDNTNYIYFLFFENFIKVISNKITFTFKLINNIYNIPFFKFSLFDRFFLELYTLEFINALEKILVMQLDDSRAFFQKENNKLMLKSGNFLNNVIIYVSFNGVFNDFNISINYKHLLSIIKVFNSSTFRINISLDKKFILVYDYKLNCLHVITTFI